MLLHHQNLAADSYIDVHDLNVEDSEIYQKLVKNVKSTLFLWTNKTKTFFVFKMLFFNVLN